MRLPGVTIRVFRNRTIDMMDRAIKTKVEEIGDFAEPSNFIARIIWNMLAAPSDERRRSAKLLRHMLQLK